MLKNNLIFIIGYLLIINIVVESVFVEMYRWKQISYDRLSDDNVIFPDDEMTHMLELEKEIARTEEFIQYNNVPIGVTHYKNKLFITVPRRAPGIPSTLNYIYTNSPKRSSPRLRAYPNYRTNQLHPQKLSDPNRIVSVYRPRVDICDRLWFIDTGILEYRNNTVQVQPPSIWIMNLLNDTILRRFEIPDVKLGNGLVSITIDVDPTDCLNAFAYIPDMRNFKIHIYSFKENRIWNLRNKLFEADPIYGKLNVDNFEFSWNDGIFSIALGNINPDGYRTAYFHPMASISEYTVSTRILRNESLTNRALFEEDFEILGERGEMTQSAMHAFDEHSGIIIYSQVNRNGVACWNTANEFSQNNFILVAQNNETMIYPADLSIDSNGIIWMITNTMPRFVYSKLDPNEYNFRLWSDKVTDAVQGTSCE